MEERSADNKDGDPIIESTTIDHDYRHDHRKRKKDTDMNEEQETTKAKLKFYWTQTERDVSLTTKIGPEYGEADKVEVTFTEQELTITLADGCRQSLALYAEIEKSQSHVQRKKRKFTITVTKKEAGRWPSLEAPPCFPSSELANSTPDLDSSNMVTQDLDSPHLLQQDQESHNMVTQDQESHNIVTQDQESHNIVTQDMDSSHMNTQDLDSANLPDCDAGQEVRFSKEEEPVLNLKMIKHDFFEKDDSLTVHMYVKNVSKDAVRVFFDKHAFTVKFQTSDGRFLQQHEGATEETVFCWQVQTKNEIVPAQCKLKTCVSYIELILTKALKQRWAGLEAVQNKVCASSVKDASWKSVQPASSGPVTSSAGAASGKTVAFDEMVGDDGSPADPLSAQSVTAKSCKGQKPTAKVEPLSKQTEVAVAPGYTGLQNLGNTCFMNSVIQVLANTTELRDFFVGQEFQKEINKDNVLGTGGQLAVCFAVLLRQLWQGTREYCVPSKLKEIVSQKANQFKGFAQHDAQEFLAFLLDILHEDLNRVKIKPYTKAVEDEGRPDHVVAEEAWNVYQQRNDSFVVDLLHGQYKSKLICPICNKVSITFDPFLNLSVPIPKRILFTVTFLWRDPARKPVKLTVGLLKDPTVQHLKEVLSRKFGVEPRNMRMFEAYNSLIWKRYSNDFFLSNLQPNDVLMVSEVLSPEVAGEEVVEIEVIQRTIIPHKAPTRCNSCQKEATTEKLKRCCKCYKVGYCDHECQRNNWTEHRNKCKTPPPSPVGCPFYISLPKSHCTYARISHLMETMARYSVDVFQPPVRGSSTLGASGSASTTMPPPSDLLLSSRPSTSNLSSSSGSQSSLDSISSCSSTATLTAGTPDHDPDPDKDTDYGAVAGSESLGSGDLDSGMGSDITDRAQLATKGQESGDAFFPSGDQRATVQSAAASLTSPADRSVPMFFIKPVKPDGQGIREQGRLDDKDAPEMHDDFFFPELKDQGDEPLDMTLYQCLSMDWRNNEKMPSYVMVESKTIHADIDPSYQKVPQGALSSEDITLEQCLELFTETEILSREEAWHCPNCKDHREASKTMSLWRLPHILIIQLKRFAFNSFRNSFFHVREKIDKMVHFPIRGLDLCDFVKGRTVDRDGETLYDLYGVVNHYGGTVGGHYTAYGRCADPHNHLSNEIGWREFNDTIVTTVVNEKKVVSSHAYLLFYRRRTPFVPSPSPSLMQAIQEQSNDMLCEEEEEPAVCDSNQWCREEVDDGPGEKQDLEKENGEEPPCLDYTDMDAVD